MRPKGELLRFAAVARGDELLVTADEAARLPGRGAYLCRTEGRVDPACAAEALRRRAIQRALRSPAAVDPQIVESARR